MAVLLMAAGGYFLYRLSAFFVLHPVKTLRKYWGADREKRRDRAKTLSLALAGTLGVGNVTGVAFCLLQGGAGSVFWMLLSAVFAAALKYAESALTVDTRRIDGRGGMPYVIEKTWRYGKTAGALYAFVCLLTAFVLGAALQARAVVETAEAVFSLPALPIALALTVFSALLVYGGKDKIAAASEVLVPLATLVYTALCLATLAVNRAALPAVFSQIAAGIFHPQSALAGAGGFLLSRLPLWVTPLARGFSSGLLSNEAGAGTSTLAHAENATATPAEEGILGTLEILADTVFLCTLTALTLLSGGVRAATPIGYVRTVFSSALGGLFALPFLFSVFVFALATVICWFHYGDACRRYLWDKKGARLFFILYLCAVFAGGVLPTEKLIPPSGVLLGFLSLLCLATLLKNADRVVLLTEKEGYIKIRKKM